MSNYLDVNGEDVTPKGYIGHHVSRGPVEWPNFRVKPHGHDRATRGMSEL